MQDYPLTNQNINFLTSTHHWCPRSEKYAGVDQLLTALYNGWAMSDVCYREDHWHGGSRCVAVYHFSLKRRNETMTMPVITNPALDRMLMLVSMRVIEIQVSARERAENTGS